jgi:DNA-binding LacI/PurR family transcriptional regulator
MVKRAQVTETVRKWILSGRLPKGVLLPPERILAKELGVSRPTLRRALEPLVNEGVLENQPGRGTLVAEFAAGVDDVRPDWKVLALMLPDISNRFFIELAESVEYSALQRGYQLLLCNSRHQAHLEEFHIRQIVTHRVKGVILAHDPHQEASAALDLLHDAAIPAVLLFSTARQAECDSVVLDDRAGVEQALRYLASLGHRRIAFCRPLPGPRPHPRETYFGDFVRRNNSLDGSCRLDVVGRTDEAIQGDLRAILAREDAPTACLAGNDNAALILMTALSALKVAVPEAFSIAGFDNLRYVQHLPVPLTTIDQPKQEMGRRAAELLFERIQAGPTLPARHEVFTPHLIIRESCAVPRPAIPQALAARSLAERIRL